MKNSRTYKNHLILAPLTSIMLSSGEKEDAPSVKAPGAFVVLGGGSVGNINLVIDASDAQRIIDQVAEALSPEQIDRLMFRTLKEVGNKTRTETGRAVSAEYAVTKGWAMARMGAPKMGGGGGSWSCVIPMRDRRGSIGGTFKLMGWHKGSKRKIGRVRAKIRKHGLTSITTGPAAQYESAAKDVSTLILDANAVRLGAGHVGVYLLLSSNEGSAAIIQSVTEALSPQEVRPLTDQVTVALATAIPYTLNVQYQAESGSNITNAIGEAVSEYQTWQDQVIGQPFNPDKLMALLYRAGCTRVIWGSGSEFGDGGSVEYTPILENQYCHGTISLAVIP